MSEIIITDVLLSVGIVASLVLIYCVNKNARRKTANDLVNRFNHLSQKNGLYFTQLEIFEDFIIGLNRIRKKLYVFKRTDKTFHLQVIDLTEIFTCSSRKTYKETVWGDTRKKYLAQVDKIWLEFEYADGREPLQVTFYEAGSNQLFAMSEMEQKLQQWENIITETISKYSRNIA